MRNNSKQSVFVTVRLREDTRWHVYPNTPEEYGMYEIEVKPFEYLGDAIARVLPQFRYFQPICAILQTRTS